MRDREHVHGQRPARRRRLRHPHPRAGPATRLDPSPHPSIPSAPPSLLLRPPAPRRAGHYFGLYHPFTPDTQVFNNFNFGAANADCVEANNDMCARATTHPRPSVVRAARCPHPSRYGSLRPLQVLRHQRSAVRHAADGAGRRLRLLPRRVPRRVRRAVQHRCAPRTHLPLHTSLPLHAPMHRHQQRACAHCACAAPPRLHEHGGQVVHGLRPVQRLLLQALHRGAGAAHALLDRGLCAGRTSNSRRQRTHNHTLHSPHTARTARPRTRARRPPAHSPRPPPTTTTTTPTTTTPPTHPHHPTPSTRALSADGPRSSQTGPAS